MSDIASKLRFTAEIAPEAQGATRLVPGARELLEDAADEIECLRKSLTDAEAAVTAIMNGEPGFDMPSLQDGLRRAVEK